MKAFLSLLLLLALVWASRASEDEYMPWNAVTLEFGYNIPSDPAAKGSVHIVSEGSRVNEITLQWNKTKLVVPATEFVGLPLPKLETLKVLSGQFYGGVNDNAPYLVVEFRFGQPTFGEYPRAQFLFYSGQYHDLRITTRTSENTWQDATKLPGKDSTPGGTTKLLLPDTTQSHAPAKDQPKAEEK